MGIVEKKENFSIATSFSTCKYGSSVEAQIGFFQSVLTLSTNNSSKNDW